jgi:hypothetical protein
VTTSNKSHSLRPDYFVIVTVLAVTTSKNIVLISYTVCTEHLVENPVLGTYLFNELKNVILMKEDTYYINMEMEMLDFWQWL